MVQITFSIICSVMIYSKYLRQKEPRHLIAGMIICFLLATFFQLMFITGYYAHLGLNRTIFLALFMMPPFGAGMALGILVPQAILGKITPSHVEATVFAFATSVIKGTRGLGGYFNAVLLNRYFIGMTATNLKDLYKAILITLVLRILVFTYLRMLPTNAAVEEVQARLKAMNDFNADTGSTSQEDLPSKEE